MSQDPEKSVNLELDDTPEAGTDTPSQKPSEPAEQATPQAPAEAGGLSLELEDDPKPAPQGQSSSAAAQEDDLPEGLKTPQSASGRFEYEYLFEGQPDFTMATVELPAGKMLKVEAAAMIAMSTNVSMKTKLKGGFKRFLTGDKLFINEFTAEQYPGSISFANGMPGDVQHYYMDGSEPLFLSSSSYLASGPNIDIQTKFQGMVKGFFSGAGLFLTRCEGTGDVFFNSYGGILAIDVKDEFFVDNNHIVAFTGGLQYEVKKFGGYKSFFLSGEGLTTKFSGEGTVWIQTRKVPLFAAWVYPFRPKKNNN